MAVSSCRVNVDWSVGVVVFIFIVVVAIASDVWVGEKEKEKRTRSGGGAVQVLKNDDGKKIPGNSPSTGNDRARFTFANFHPSRA